MALEFLLSVQLLHQDTPVLDWITRNMATGMQETVHSAFIEYVAYSRLGWFRYIVL